MRNNFKIGFFGSSEFSVHALNEMEKAGIVPDLIITTPDKPQGRSLTLSPTPVKIWANERKIKCFDPAKLDDSAMEYLKGENCDVFIVASYGKIIPEKIFDLPSRKTINIHPSLLPKYRGASPLQSAMLDDSKDTGVTIISIDKEMDHGPIIAREKVHIEEWQKYEKFEKYMAEIGGKLIAKILPEWMESLIKPIDQEHSQATYTEKIDKGDGEINLNEDEYANFRKIQAYHSWPVAYFFHKKDNRDIRVKITEASFENGKLAIKKVIPEGKKEMSYKDFVSGYKTNL